MCFNSGGGGGVVLPFLNRDQYNVGSANICEPCLYL